MSESEGPVADDGPPDFVRFLLVALAALVVAVSLFLLVRARQQANADHKYQACLEQVSRRDNPPGFRPEDYCQRPG